METFIVIPCLNEEATLAHTCTSLGFTNGSTCPGRLVLVDNGSTDGTPVIMQQVRSSAAAGAVELVREPVRGYVPARRAGIVMALACARKDRIPLNEVLILQADADTIYLDNYVEAMRSAAAAGTGQLLEGSALTDRAFNAQYPEFVRLCRIVDKAMEPFLAPEEEQVVVDDKVSGFWLSDYLRWGEHQDEVDTDGRLILAETTRLLMRARRTAVVRRTKVHDACALPSRRKVLLHSPAYFASSGFPRDVDWMAEWSRVEDSAAFLKLPFESPALERLIRSRQRHQLALFSMLPQFIRSAEPAQISMPLQPLATTTAHLLARMLTLADQEGGLLDVAAEDAKLALNSPTKRFM